MHFTDLPTIHACLKGISALVLGSAYILAIIYFLIDQISPQRPGRRDGKVQPGLPPTMRH